ncbi:hypothetical protein L249_4196 [Ophiocordyceps polyrhachis-furcata BCC 54312]|uniref:Uncharacterized protein n=1 Tax=Ophiocordyceps polyrhachis-furcata BCC 54312 TaxID=1330021 RepID=A0A367LBX1_9HYPO|nr:hypothetical protein L249_4196 [Ophiocordyceps polyrhachis-furcata BCC 54312]
MPSPIPPQTEGKHSDQSPSPTASPRKAPRTSRGGLQGLRQRQTKQPLLIRMNLTETQMDRITDAFTKNVGSSPLRARPTAQLMPKTEISSDAPQSCNMPYGAAYSVSCSGDDVFSMAAPSVSDLACGQRALHQAASLAERRQKQTPASIQVWKGPQSRATDHLLWRPSMEPVPNHVSPPSLVREGGLGRPASRSQHISPYIPGTQSQMAAFRCTEPRVGPRGESKPRNQDSHEAWERPYSPSRGLRLQPHLQGFDSCPQWPEYAQERLQQTKRSTSGALPSPLPTEASPPVSAEQNLKSPFFSPLALYFRGQGFPTTKMGEKTMIGHNGWLERTNLVSDDNEMKKALPKKGGILGTIRKMAKDMTAEFQNSNRRLPKSVKETHLGQMQISLDPREQSLLYCELEFHLTTALSDYITAELDKGHLVAGNLKQVSDFWASRGRPKVVGFRYDLETQLQLICLHAHDFDFHGRPQRNLAEIGGLLGVMKTHARQMRVRTFCQPDSVIAKQLADAQALFDLINVNSTQQLALSEAANFFEVIVEREREERERRLQTVRRTYVPGPGQRHINGKCVPQEEPPRPQRLGHTSKSGHESTYI